jgi:hypothetical protein
MPKTEHPIPETAAKDRDPGAPEMTKKEAQDYVEQVEEFEGPDRREKRGTEDEPPDEPGVSRS